MERDTAERNTRPAPARPADRYVDRRVDEKSDRLKPQLTGLSFEAGEALLEPPGGGRRKGTGESRSRDGSSDAEGIESVHEQLDPETSITKGNRIDLSAEFERPAREFGVASGVVLRASFEQPLLARHFSDKAWVRYLASLSDSWRVDRVTTTLSEGLKTVTESILPLAGRSFWPESPEERFDDAARAGFASIPESRRAEFAARFFNQSPVLANAPLGKEVPLARAELEVGYVPSDPQGFDLAVVVDAVKGAAPALKAIELKATGRATREAFMSGDDVFAAVQAQAKGALLAEGFGKALRAAIEARAKGPFDAGAIRALDRQELLATLRTLPGGEAISKIESLVPQWDRSLLPEGATDLSGLYEGAGSATITGSGAKTLSELAGRLGDVPFSEIVQGLQPIAGEATAGDAPTTRDASACRRALVVFSPPEKDQSRSEEAAAAAEALGFEVDRVYLSREKMDSSGRVQDAGWSAECIARQGGATLAMISSMAPGDEMMVYTAWHSVDFMAMITSQARGRGLHAAYFGAMDGGVDAELAELGAGGEAAKTMNLPTLPVGPDEAPEVAEEVFIANAVATRIGAGASGDRILNATGLRASRVFAPGAPLGGKLGNVESSVVWGPIDERVSKAAEIHAVLCRFIDDLRIGLAMKQEANANHGALAMHTSSGDEAVPDKESWTDKVLRTPLPLDEGIAKVAGDQMDRFNGQSLVRDGKKAGGAKRALVVGNSFPMPYLDGALLDAKDMAARRKGEGFEVTSRQDLKSGDLGREVREFFGAARAGERSDFYYAGHGRREGLVGVDGLVVGSGVIAANVARATQAGAEVTTTIDACFAGKLPVAAEKALDGKDHLPKLAMAQGDDRTTVGLATEANALRDLYLVLSGGGTLGLGELASVATGLSALAAIDVSALKAKKRDGTPAVTLVQLAELHARVCREVEARRAEAKKKAWLDRADDMRVE